MKKIRVDRISPRESLLLICLSLFRSNHPYSYQTKIKLITQSVIKMLFYFNEELNGSNLLKSSFSTKIELLKFLERTHLDIPYIYLALSVHSGLHQLFTKREMPKTHHQFKESSDTSA